MIVEPTNFQFKSDDGAEIHGYRWTPIDSPRGVVHIVHGLAEHAARYSATANFLAAAGYLVYAHDHRGHGLTAGSPDRCGNLAEIDGWNRAVRDIVLLLEDERRENPRLPLVLLAHSMGSFMAQQVMYQHSGLLDGCALSGSRGKADLRVHFIRTLAMIEKRRIGNKRSWFLQNFSLRAANREFRPVRTDFDWLSRDPAVVDRFIADPYCGWAGPPQLWLDLTYGIIQMGRQDNQRHIPKDLPVYIFGGTRDPVSDGCKGLRQLIEAYRRMGLTRIQFKFYPEARHETLNEINREEVLTDLLHWLVSRAPRLV